MASEDDRLKAVIAREKARRAREAEEAAKAETREREKAELRRSAQQRWASLLPQLRAVVATLNEQIKEADLELELREDSTKPDAAVAWRTFFEKTFAADPQLRPRSAEQFQFELDAVFA